MKDLYTYISEAKGYLDYDLLVNDIIHEIYFNDEIKNYFIERYNKAIEYASEGNGNDIVPGILYFLGRIRYIEDFSNKTIKIVSKNYPSWLNELQIILKQNEDYVGEAFIDTDLLDPNKKTGVIFIDIICFYRHLVDSFEYFVRKKYRSFRKEDIDKLEYITDKEYESLVNEEDLDLSSKKETLSHEIKHIFDYFITTYKNTSMKKSFETGTRYSSSFNYETQPESVQSFVSICTSHIMYPFDKAELSALQQEFIQGVKDKTYDRDFINSLLSSLKNSSIDNFYKKEKNALECKERIKNTYFGSLYYISLIYNNITDLDMTENELSEVIKDIRLSDVILSKPFNGKTFNDAKVLFKRLYLYGEKEIKKIIAKAAKNL
jgi:hypothetical protein